MKEDCDEGIDPYTIENHFGLDTVDQSCKGWNQERKIVVHATTKIDEWEGAGLQDRMNCSENLEQETLGKYFDEEDRTGWSKRDLEIVCTYLVLESVELGSSWAEEMDPDRD